MALTSLTLDQFLDRLVSAEPTPGGGALAALTGASAAAMLAMVCNLTIGRPRFAAGAEQISQALAHCQQLRQRLSSLADADADAYQSVVEARRLPSSTASEKAARQAAIERAMRTATEVPIATAEACSEVMAAALKVAEHGNPGVLADVAVAVHIAHGAALAAADQAHHNIPWLHEPGFIAVAGERIGRIRTEADVRLTEALGLVNARLGHA